MRGKVVHLLAYLRQGRITPAYAGKSAEGVDLIPANMDHPRVCGEKTKKIP